MKGREFVTSDEAMMTAKNMCKNVISTVDDTLAAFKPRKNFEFIKVNKLPKKKIVHPLTY